jgi:uncharacterized protein YjbI with pentapeptide repeats
MSNSIVIRKNSGNSLTIAKSGSVSTTLVPATNTTIGGIIVGDNLSITGNGVLSAQPGGVTAFNNRTGNVSLTANDVTTIVDANYIQVWKDTQTTAGTLSQFPKYSSITSASGPIQGYSRGLLTSNTSGTVTKTIFDGSLLASSSSTAALQYKSIGFNSNDTGSANSSKTGRVMVGQYGEIFLDSVTKTNANTITSATFELTGGVRPQGTTQLYDPHIPSGIRCKYTAGATGSYNPSNYEEVPEAGYYRSAEYTINQLSQAVTYSNSTAIGRPSQFQIVARSSWAGTDSNLSFSQAYDYRTILALGESAELIFQNFGRTALRTPNMTDYSILTQGYADTRYQAVGAYLTSANLTFANLTGTPTTLAGYGITDGLTSANLAPYLTISSANATYSVLGHTHSIANVTGLQTALDAKLETSNFTYASLTGKPSTFAPSAHTHAISEVTGLQTALDLKLPSANFTYANITGTPNLTVYLTTANATAIYQPLGNYATTSCLTFANLTGKPTTLSGYGITDGYSTSNPSGYITAGANSFTGTQNLQDNVLIRAKLRDYSESVSSPTISSGTLTLNLETSNIFTVSLNAAITTLTISNPPASGSGGSFTLIFTADGTARAVTWPAAIKWASGTAPTITSTSGKVDSFAFFTSDGGTTWQGYIGGQNF